MNAARSSPMPSSQNVQPGRMIVPTSSVKFWPKNPVRNVSGRKNVATQPSCFMVRFILLPTVDW